MKQGILNQTVKKGLSLWLVGWMALAPLATQAQARQPEALPNTALKQVLDTVSAKYDVIFAKMPKEVLNQIELRHKAELNAEVARRLTELRSGDKPVTQVRAEMRELAQQALIEQKRELFQQVHNLPVHQLDQIADSLQGHVSYRQAVLKYRSAYTRTEKANALTEIVSSDLDHLNTMLGKRTHLMSREALANDLTRMQGIHNVKGEGSRKWLKTLGIAVLGVAAVGLVSWGVAESIHGGRFERHRDGLDRQYDQLRKDLEAKYNAFAIRLDAEEKKHLADNGFVLTTCGTYQMPDSILCNRYDYALFSGTKYCSVQCYKSTTSGKETLHQPPTCTSPFIPTNCYDPREYEMGRSDGYQDGYSDGTSDGAYEGDRDGTVDGQDEGYADGYEDGYDDGYDLGFSDGYAGRSRQHGFLALTLNAQGPGFDRGYQAGMMDAQLLVRAGGVQ